MRIPAFPAQDTRVHWQGAGGGYHLRLPGRQGLPRGSGSRDRGAQSQGALHGAQWRQADYQAHQDGAVNGGQLERP